MNRINQAVLLTIIVCLLAGCQATPTSTPQVPTAQPTLTTVPPTPTTRVWPTSSTPAPEEPVIPVGHTTTLQDTQHGVSGKAVMAGLQTILINEFTYDGQGPAVDVRLVKEGDLGNAVAILGKLEQRPYDGELLIFTVPSDLKPGDADSISVYCYEFEASFGWGRFQ